MTTQNSTIEESFNRYISLVIKNQDISDYAEGLTDEESNELENLEKQILDALKKSGRRLTDNMVKIVVCTKCNRHRTPYGYYPKTQCVCGSYESEERDTTLEELFRIDSQYTNLVKAIQEITSNDWLEIRNVLTLYRNKAMGSEVITPEEITNINVILNRISKLQNLPELIKKKSNGTS